MEEETIKLLKQEFMAVHYFGRIAGKHDHHVIQIQKMLGMREPYMECVCFTLMEAVFDVLGERADIMERTANA